MVQWDLGHIVRCPAPLLVSCGVPPAGENPEALVHCPAGSKQAVPHLRSFNAAPATEDGQTEGNLVMLDVDAHRIENVVVRPPEDVSVL